MRILSKDSHTAFCYYAAQYNAQIKNKVTIGTSEILSWLNILYSEKQRNVQPKSCIYRSEYIALQQRGIKHKVCTEVDARISNDR